MRVGGNHDFDAALLGEPQMRVAQIEAVGIRVAFDGDAVSAASVENPLHIVIEGIPAQHKTSRGMRDNLRVRIFDGGEDAIRHCGTVEIHIGVNGNDNKIELREDFIGQVERAIFQNIYFAAGEPPTLFSASRIFLICARVRFSSRPLATVTALE